MPASPSRASTIPKGLVCMADVPAALPRSAARADETFGPGFHLRPEPRLGVLKVRIFGDEDPGTLAAVLGGGLPAPRGSAVGAGGVTCAWLAPGEWLILGPEAALAPLADRLDAAWQVTTALVTDHSHAAASFILTGPAGRDRLAAVCPLDLRDGSFPPGAVARSLLNGTGLFLARLADEAGAPAFRLIVDQTAAAHAVRLIGLPTPRGAP